MKYTKSIIIPLICLFCFASCSKKPEDVLINRMEDMEEIMKSNMDSPDVGVDKLPVNWAIGQRAEVYIEIEKKNKALIFPEKYIKWRHNVPGVFVADQGSASWRPVEIGIYGDSFIEAIEGLHEGDNLLMPMNLKDKLMDGMRISLP